MQGKWVRTMQAQMQAFHMACTHGERHGVSPRVWSNRPLNTELNTWCYSLDVASLAEHHTGIAAIKKKRTRNLLPAWAAR